MLIEKMSETTLTTGQAKIVAVANQKGGVGKTTTTINLATAMAAVRKKVLILDLDPQGNASTGIGVDRLSREISSYDVLIGSCTMREATISTSVPGLDIIPSTIDLSGAELELVNLERRTDRLKEALLDPAVMNSYDIILIDCPPSLGLLTLNALVASNSVLIPLQCEFFALEGLSLLLKTIERVQANFNPELEIYGVVLTMFDQRNNLSGQVAEDVRAHMGGKPALLYDYRCAGSQAYILLASEIIKRDRKAAA